MAERLVLRGGVVGRGSAIGVEDGVVALLGSDDDAQGWVGTGEGAPEVVDLDGALVTPAFVDSHVHTVRTGSALTGLDLTGLTTLDAVLDAVADHAAARPGAGVVVGQGWDETGWREGRPPTGEELERAAPGRRVHLTRVDAHSAVLSPALAALVPGLPQIAGWSADGRVERDAHHAARVTLESLVSDAERLDAARAACRALAAAGIVGFHENAAPHIGPESELALVRRAAGETGLHATLYWGQLVGTEHEARELAGRLGVAGLAGDLIADGAFGSRTAALGTAYDDAPHTCGHAFLTAEQVRTHVVACSRAGVQAGLHVIGDAALEEVAAGLQQAGPELGDVRLEHVELPSARVLDLLEELGVHSSVQPMFDALWGGPDKMYAARLGERWRESNPFARLGRAGRISFGSDSPVTALDPWATIRAAVHHHQPEHAMTRAAAVRAHTVGGWAAAGPGVRPSAGLLEVGAPAHLAVWRTPGGLDADRLPVLEPDTPLPELDRLVSAGRTIHHGAAR